MTALIVEQQQDSITLQITIPFKNSMLESESIIQDALNELGVAATQELLKKFDTDGSPIVVAGIKLTSKGKESKYYQTPYGEVSVERHVYQSTAGGSTYCPLERNARIVLSSTPRFASQISHKMAVAASTEVERDLIVNHNRKVARSFIQRLSDTVAAIIHEKEEDWSYHVPEVDETVRTVTIGLDGTCMLMCEDGFRQAMVGTIALYNTKGERLHTTYIAASPEYGKEEFKQRFIREIERTKGVYSKAFYLGLADGAKDNWDFLEQHTDDQTLDFYHVTEYLTKIADNIFPDASQERSEWLEDRCHRLKHKVGSAKRILKEFKILKNKKLSDKAIEALDAAITYFTNNIKKTRMSYAKNIKANRPIGSGVTEAACKVIVKQRLCKSGMKWKEKGARAILSLRTLVCSTGAWENFWKKVNQYGVPSLA